MSYARFGGAGAGAGIGGGGGGGEDDGSNPSLILSVGLPICIVIVGIIVALVVRCKWVKSHTRKTEEKRGEMMMKIVS